VRFAFANARFQFEKLRAVLVLGIRFPGAEIPDARHYASARPGFRQDFRAEHPHELRPQPHGDDVRVLEVRIERILVQELHAIADAVLLRDLARFHDELLVDLDTTPARRRVELGGFHDDASIARTEIEHHVTIMQPGELQHARHVVLLGRDEDREALLRNGGCREKQRSEKTEHCGPAPDGELRAQSVSG
jgi:hypothetical protein